MLRSWVMAGFLGSAAAFYFIAMTGFATTGLTLTPLVVALGFFNDMFAVAAIGSMMALASQRRGAWVFGLPRRRLRRALGA
jgi:BCD family chlorophyll transporter-like MFS transporter